MEDLSDREISGPNECIYVTHVTVRESLYILAAKLVVIEIIASGFLLLACTPFACVNSYLIQQTLVIGAALFKLGLTAVTAYQWINDSYEISPTRIVHTSGFLYQTRKDILFSHVASAGIEQGLLGRLFNFGTLKLFNGLSKDYFYMFQIHNPNKYFHLINRMNPELDENTHTVREHLKEIEKDF